MAPTAAGRTGEPSPTRSALGLTSDEAARRLRRHGPNALPEPPRPGTPRRVAAQLRSPLVGLLGLAAALSLALGELVDAAVILAVVALNALLGVLEERRADSAARALREVLRPTAVVERDGRPAEVDVARLVPGDIVVLDAGDRVPADGRIVEAQELELDESMLTGESLPVTRAAGELLAGTTVSSGLARMEVTATGARTRLGEIVAAAGRTRPVTPLERRLARLAHVLLIAGGGICVVLALIAWAYGMALGDAALVGVALAVAAMPEGLPAVVSITLALGVRGMAREGAIVRRLHAVETLGCTTVICADKTGTLTENRMAVVRVLDAGGAETVRDAGGPVTGAAADVLRAAAVACEASPLAPGRRVGVEPTEAAVLEAAEAAGVTARLRGEGVRIVALEPFDSARRRVSALVEDRGGTRTVYVKGAPEALLGELDDGAVAARLEAAATRWGDEGMRVLLVARGAAPGGPALRRGAALTALGLVGISDPPRPGIGGEIARARGAGVRTVMVTGDHPATAAAIAGQAGIATAAGTTVTGADLEALTDAELAERLRDAAVIARVAPGQKLRIVEALRADGEIVAMTGDGINDVPALRAADIGIAMGGRGSDAATEAADMVLTDDRYGTIVLAIGRGRMIYDNIVRTVHFLLAANLGEVATFALVLPLGLGSPLTVPQILLMNLLTDALPAIALSTDPPERAVMRRPPRPAAEGLLGPVRERLVTAGLATGACGCAAFAIGRASGTADGQTMAFVTLVAAQLAYVFSVRGSDWPWRAGRNVALWAAVAASAAVVAALLAVPGLRSVFDIAPLSAGQVVLALALAALPALLAEALKAARRRRTAGGR
jgi:Ca2+-transporting ATPase